MEPRRVADILQERGVRATQQRMAVYDYLLLHPIHPTADMIFTALTPRYPSFSRTTIYNTLHTLVDAGLIREVNIDPQEQRFDGNPSDHGHFRCRHCGEIFDFDPERSAPRPLPPGVHAGCTRCLSRRSLSRLPAENGIAVSLQVKDLTYIH